MLDLLYTTTRDRRKASSTPTQGKQNGLTLADMFARQHFGAEQYLVPDYSTVELYM